MSTELANVIAEGLDVIVELLNAAGIPATRDPAEFQPPGAIVAAPSVLSATHGGLTLSVPVFLVTPDPGKLGTDELLELLVLALPRLGTSSATPTQWISPINPDGLPAYLIPVTLTVEG